MQWSVEQRAAKVEAIVTDVDGVLTRGDIIFGPGGEWKVFNVQDGHGFSIARKAGLKLALLTGRSSEAVRRRAGELQVNGMLEGVEDKGAGVIALLEKLSVAPENACYIGDDLVDIPAMKKTGFPVAVVNAVAEVKQEAAWVTTRSGGDGAFREVVEFVLKSKGLWKDVLKRYGC